MYADAMYADAMTADAWIDGPADSLFAERSCDLEDLPEDAAEAVLVAGAILQAYLEDAARLPEA